GDHALEGRLRLVVRAETDGRPSRMAGERDAAEAVDLGDEVLRREPNVAEVEAREDVRVHAVDEHVAVIRLHLRGGQAEEAIAILELAVVAAGIELPVLRQNDAVERTLVALALQQLQIRLDRRAAVVRELGVQMEVEDHGAVQTAGSVGSASSWS